MRRLDAVTRTVAAPPRRRRRWRLALAVLGLCALLIAGGFFPQEPLRRLVETRLRAALGPDVQVQRLHVVPALLRADLYGFRLATTTVEARVEHARLALAWGCLWGQPWALRRLELHAPQVRLTPSTTPGRNTPWRGPLVVQSVLVTEGRLDWRTGDGTLLQWMGLAATGALGQGQLDVQIASGRLTRPSAPAPLTLAALRARLASDPTLALRLISADARVGDSRLMAQGALGAPGAWRPEVDVTGTLALADLGIVLPTPRLIGRAELTGNLRPEKNGLRLELSARGPALQVETWALQQAELRVLHHTAGVGETQATLRARALGGGLRADAHVLGTQLEAALDLVGIDAAQLARRVGPRGAFPGRLSAQARLRGPLERALHVDAQAQAQLALVDLPALGVNARAQGTVELGTRRAALRWQLDARASGQPEQAFVAAEVRAEGQAQGPWPPPLTGTLVGHVALRGPQAPLDLPFSGQGQIWQGRSALVLDADVLRGRVHAQVSSGGAFIDALHVSAEGLQLNALHSSARGTLALEANLAGPPAALEGLLHAQAREAAWDGAPTGPVEAQLALVAGHARLTASAPALGAELAGTPSATSFEGTLRLDRASLTRLGRLAGQPLEGEITASAALRVPWRAPREAGLDARVSALEIGPDERRLRSLRPFEFAYSAQRARVAGLLLEGSGARLEADGSWDGPHQALQARARVEADLARLPSNAGPRLGGRLTASIAVEGSARQPRATGQITIDAASVRASLWPDIDLPQVRLELVGDRVRLPDTSAPIAGGTLTLRGEVPWAAFWPAARHDHQRLSDGERGHLEARLQDLDLAAAMARLRPEGTLRPAGQVSARLELEGGVRSLDELAGRLYLPQTALHVGEVEVELQPAELTLRAGSVRGDGLELRSPEGSLRVTGDVDLLRRAWNLKGQGGLDLRVLAALGTLGVTGRSQADLTLAGPWSAPRAAGTLHVADASLRLRTLAQPLTDIGGRLRFEGDALRIEEFQGRFGGGALTAAGSARWARTGLQDVAVSLSARDVGLRYPVGLRSRLDADLRLAGRAGALLLSGSVRAPRAFYDLDAVAEHSLFGRVVVAEPSPLLRSIGLDLDVQLLAPARARSRNALADLDVTGALRLRGDLESPAPFGRLTVAVGGNARVQGHEFVLVEDGALAYDGTWNARLGLTARSRDSVRDRSGSSAAASYRVVLEATGSLAAPELHFRTEPRAFVDGQVLNLLANGDPGEGEAYRSGGRLVGEQALLVLGGGRLTRGLAGQLEALGVDEVSVEPRLLARDTRPGARFTFGKRLGAYGRVVYSTSLNDASQRFVKLEAGPWHALTVTGQRDESGTLRAGAGQTLEWGAARAARASAPRDEALRLTAVHIEGDEPLPAQRLRSLLALKPGQRRSSLSLLDDAERLRAGLLDAGYVEAEVGVRSIDGEVWFKINSGPRFETRVTGFTPAPDLRPLLRRALFEDEALELGRARLLRSLHASGHLRAQVRTSVEPGVGLRTLVFEVQAGPRLHVAALHLRGARRLDERALVRAAGGLGALVSNPVAAAEAWRTAYRAVQLLAVRITGPTITQRGAALVIEADIDEGAAPRLTAVRFEGNSRPEPELREALALALDTPFDPAALAPALERLRGFYLGRGYAGVGLAAHVEPQASDYTLVVDVREGLPVTLAAVNYTGAAHTSTSLLAARARLQAGQPLDLRKLAEAEQRLIDLTTISGARALPDPERPGQVDIVITEAAPNLLSYELTWEDARGFVGQIDGERRHLFRRAGVLGGRYRLGRDDSEARAYFGIPLGAGSFTLSAARRAEDVESLLGPFTRLQREFELLHDVPFGEHWRVQGRYRFKRITLRPLQAGAIDTAVFGASALRDTRDNRLDPRHGRFYSSSLELAQRTFGSNLEYIKGFAQASLARTRGRVTWAQGYRIGVGHGLGGQPLAPSSERYRAGGGDTVRGYARDALGPRDFLGDAAGGEAVLVLNQELRYRHGSGLGGVLFWDAGNVYEKLGDLGGLRLRHAWGLGLRYASAVGLLRLDVGLPIARRPGERGHHIYFSLGQAF